MLNYMFTFVMFCTVLIVHTETLRCRWKVYF